MWLVTRTGDMRNAYKILVQKSAREGPFGTPDRTLENNIKMYVEETGEIVLGLFGTEYSTITIPVSVTTEPAY
jgi:hypothetical protein